MRAGGVKPDAMEYAKRVATIAARSTPSLLSIFAL